MPKKTKKAEVRFKLSKTNVFAMVMDKKNKIHVCLGGYDASRKTFDTYEQAEEFIAAKPWELLINVCAIIMTKNNEKEVEKGLQGDM